MNEHLRRARHILVVSALAAGGLTVVLARPAPAAELVAETFRNDSTPAGQWSEVSPAGQHTPCLTAAVEPPPGSLKACRSGPGDRVGEGAFQLTDNSRQQGGALLLHKAIPSKAGLSIAFDMFMYGSKGKGAADGISFFLVDGEQESVKPGKPGGGLAYDGMEGAFVGIGFDEHGNFSHPRSFGSGPGKQPRHVVVRGADTTRWKYLAGKRSPLPLAVGEAATRDAARRSVLVTLSTEDVLNVDIDYHDGTGMRKILEEVPLNRLEGQPELPPTVKLGFAAATGNDTAYHEIRDFSVNTLDPGLTTTVSADDAFRPGETGNVEIAVSNDPGAGPTSGPITTTLPVPEGLTVESAEGEGWTCDTEDGKVVCVRPGTGEDALPPGECPPPIRIALGVPCDACESVTLQATSETPGREGGASEPVTVPIEPAADPGQEPAAG